MAKLRLDRFLSSQGLGSRTQVREFLKQGGVTVNGQVQKRYEYPVDPEKDRTAVDGKEVRYQKNLYLMMNKPQGVVCATEDRKDRTVLDLLPEELRRRGLFPAGRLDKDTTGFVLLTDDGTLAHQMLSPKKHVQKRYVATLDGPVSPRDIDMLEKGKIVLDGEACQQAWFKVRKEGEQPLVELVVTQGKYHQVKRMFEAVGRQVLTLHREAIGRVLLDQTLAPGAFRELTEEELSAILQ